MGTYFPACFVPPARGHTHTQRPKAHTETQRPKAHTHKHKGQKHTHRHTKHQVLPDCWAEARVKIARMTLTIKLDGNWSSFQLANCAPPLGVTDSAIAPSARMLIAWQGPRPKLTKKGGTYLSSCFGAKAGLGTHTHTRHQPQEEATMQAARPDTLCNSTLELLGLCSPAKIERFTLMRPIHGNL